MCSARLSDDEIRVFNQINQSTEDDVRMLIIDFGGFLHFLLSWWLFGKGEEERAVGQASRHSKGARIFHTAMRIFPHNVRVKWFLYVCVLLPLLPLLLLLLLGGACGRSDEDEMAFFLKFFLLSPNDFICLSVCPCGCLCLGENKVEIREM